MESWIFLAFCFFIYTIIDSNKRGGINWLFVIGNAVPVIGVFVIPFYLAQRPLIDSEVRHGGTGWNVCRYFAIIWTIAMAVGTMAGMANASEHMDRIDSDAGRAGAAIGAGIGMGMMFCVWICGAGGAMLVGLMLKNSAIVEQATPSALSRAGTSPARNSPIARAATTPAQQRQVAAPQPAPVVQPRPIAPPTPTPTDVMISVARAGAVMGTYPIDDFKSRIASGQFIATDHYWKSGMTAWETVANFQD